MKQRIDTDSLLRYLAGEGTDSERRQLESKIDASVEAQRDLQMLKSIGMAGKIEVETTLLRPFFVDRVQKKLAARVAGVAPAPDAIAEELFASLLPLFRRMSVAAVVLIAVLTAYNIRVSAQYEADLSAAEAVLGLPPVTLATAYSALDQQDFPAVDTP
jgi:hypothetical protein